MGFEIASHIYRIIVLNESIFNVKPNNSLGQTISIFM